MSEEIPENVSKWIHTAPLLFRLIQALLTALIVLSTLVSIAQGLISYSFVSLDAKDLFYYQQIYLGTSTLLWSRQGSCRGDTIGTSFYRLS
jgi:hypothetical protein